MRWPGRSGCDQPTRALRRRIRPKAIKELAKLDKSLARRVLRSVAALALDPRPSGSRPLVGFPNLWRIRVGDYRVIYTIKDAELVVLALRVAHRGVAYRNL